MPSPAKTFGLSSSLNEQVTVMAKTQGIVSILGSDCYATKSPTLRRTLSADMSSKKWLSQHGFSPLKKIASSEQFLVSSTYSSSSSEGDDDYEEHHLSQSEIWNAIQEDKNKNEVDKKPEQFDTWSSILSQKSQQDSKDMPPPYVHPLLKRSASSLSEKSLQICTESLGSETGSDGFSSHPPSQTGDAEDDKEEKPKDEKVAQKFDMDDWRVEKYNLAAANRQKSSPKSFPPSIPSLSSRDGASMHMRCRRDNGRLVLEAVSVPSQNNFRAQRQDGRLVLTFINRSSEVEEEQVEAEPKISEVQFEIELENCEEKEPEEKADLTDDDDDDDDDEEEEEEEEEEVERDRGGGGDEKLRIVTELAPNLRNGVMSVHNLAPLMRKSMVLANTTPRCPKKINKPVKYQEEEEEEEEVVAAKPINPLTRSLPPRPPGVRMIPSPPKEAVTATGKAAAASTSASFNTYEYYCRPKGIAGTATVLNPMAQKPPSIVRNINNYNNNQLMVLEGNGKKEMVVLRGSNGDYLVPFCKELRRSFLFGEPYCVASS